MKWKLNLWKYLGSFLEIIPWMVQIKVAEETLPLIL